MKTTASPSFMRAGAAAGGTIAVGFTNSSVSPRA